MDSLPHNGNSVMTFLNSLIYSIEILKNVGNQTIIGSHWLPWCFFSILLKSMAAGISYRFVTTWGWVNHKRICIFGQTIPLILVLVNDNNHAWVLFLLCLLQSIFEDGGYGDGSSSSIPWSQCDCSLWIWKQHRGRCSHAGSRPFCAAQTFSPPGAQEETNQPNGVRERVNAHQIWPVHNLSKLKVNTTTVLESLHDLIFLISFLSSKVTFAVLHTWREDAQTPGAHRGESVRAAERVSGRTAFSSSCESTPAGSWSCCCECVDVRWIQRYRSAAILCRFIMPDVYFPSYLLK